ncbi:insK [Escherichia coli DEC6B]|nr:insK [Escherichia coli DEC6B]
MLDVHPSGFYAWLQQPHSQRHQADLRLTGQIKTVLAGIGMRLWLSQNPSGSVTAGNSAE